MRFIFCPLFILFSFAAAANLVSPNEFATEVAKTPYKDQCEEIKKFIIKRKYKVECRKQYHHYNSKGWEKNYSEKASSTVRIAGFNVLNAGNTKNAFKDFKILAKVINKYDVISASELLPVIGRDLINNKKVVAYINDVKDSAKARMLYRPPGYIKILNELRKLDKSWSLILAPAGQAASASNVHELIGFYYRSSLVKPISNEHCSEFSTSRSKKSFACFVDLTKKFLNENAESVFSRRPFLGSFKSGTFDFSLVTSHSIYKSPKDKERMKSILMPSFGISHYKEMGSKGFTGQTYARFAEAKIILDILHKLSKKYTEKDVLYVGDMNLEKKNAFWDKMFIPDSQFKLLGDSLSTLSKGRVNSQGEENEGGSKNFDHFIINSQETSNECGTTDGVIPVETENFLKSEVRNLIDKKYLVRKESKFLEDIEEADYLMRVNAGTKISKLTKSFKDKIEKVKTITRDQIVLESFRIEKRVEKFKKRLFINQLYEKTYFMLYQEVVSDHFPISINCKTKYSDDD